MSAMLQDCPPVQSAYEEFRRFSAAPEMREKVRARERFLIDQRLRLATAKREGREEGREEEKRETAQNMKARGLDSVLISEITGLSLSEIERLD